MVLGRNFFNRSPDLVAHDLIGKYLVCKLGDKATPKKITEAEAYAGEDDFASHARFGKTKRNEVMWDSAGLFYVYFIYGMYWMLNVVCLKRGQPSAVLIRGVEGFPGPGKLTRAFGIDGKLTGKVAGVPSGLWFEDRGFEVVQGDIAVSKRIGVDFAGKWKNKLWNFKLNLRTKS